MKKIASIFLSLLFALLFPLVSACGEPPAESSTDNPPDEFYYIVTLNLDYVVPCTYRRKTSSELQAISVLRDGRILDLTYAVPIGDTEYEFSYWEYVSSDGTKHKITSSTKFTKELFGEEKQITVNAVCISDFTPRA